MGGTEILVSYTTLFFAALFAVILGPQVEAVRPGLGPLRYLGGAVFAVLLYLAVLLHEASHAIVARRFGDVVPSITLHFLGGMTAVQGEARTARQEFLVAVVGPLTSLAVGGLAYLAYVRVEPGLVALALFGLASGNLLIGVLNLVPGLPLDGGRVFKAAVWAVSGDRLRGVVVAAWGGRVVAVLMLAWPVLAEVFLQVPPDLTTILVSFLLAAFIWTAAGSELSTARVRSRLPALAVRDLARRTLAVPGDLPLGEAVRRARDAQAGGIVTVTSAGEPIGVVIESALAATPEDRRPWVPTSSVARSLDASLPLSVDLRGEDLVDAITRRPAAEYLVVETDGTLHGVLVTADVDRAVRDAGSRPRGGRPRGGRPRRSRPRTSRPEGAQ